MKTCPLCETAYPSHHTNCPSDGAILIETRELEQGTVIRGKYRILRQIGRGGMGTVYLAEHIMLGRLRALKFISSELSRDAIFLRRFRREAQAATELRHPNIVEVVDLDQAEDGTPYMAMEFVEGPGLRHVLSNGALPVERALTIAYGIAQGLSAAHAKGIIHRDVKPENILLGSGNGAPEIPKLLDFGIAAMKESATVASHTHGLMLTPPYAAPEQWKGMPAEELDGRSDIYALGGVLYEMLTGHTPFHAHNTEGWMYQHLYADPRPPSQLRSDLGNIFELNGIVLRMLERDRERRFSSAVELLDALTPLVPAQSIPTIYDTPHNLRPSVVTGPRTNAVPDNLPENKSESVIFAEPVRQPSKLKWFVAAAVIILGIGIWVATGFTGSKPATEPPVFTLAGGTYPEAHAVGITDPTPNADIHYTVDGSQPSESSPIYALPIWPLPSGATVRAMATTEGHAPSPVVSSTYVWSAASRSAGKPSEGVKPLGIIAGAETSSYNEGKSAYDHKQFIRARMLFKQACDAGDMRACNYLGYLYAQGIGGTQNSQQARNVFGIACDQGTWSSCASLGSMYQDLGNNGDARKYFKKACDGGSAEGCSLLHGVQ
jgi:serine/threonine-protein kinase